MVPLHPSLVAFLAACLILLVHGQRSSKLFKCPSQFGYFADEADCSKYYLCVFGDSMHERCPAGLYFSTSLHMCDWQRNVKDCSSGGRTTQPPDKRPTASSQHSITSRYGQTARVSTSTSPPRTFRPATYPPRNATTVTVVRRPVTQPPVYRRGGISPFYVRATTPAPQRVRDPESERAENEPDYERDPEDDSPDLSVYVKPVRVVNSTLIYGRRPAPQPPLRVLPPTRNAISRPSQSLYGEETLNTHRHTVPAAPIDTRGRLSPLPVPQRDSYDDDEYYDDEDDEYYDEYDDDEPPQPIPTTPRSRFPIRVQQPTPRGFTTSPTVRTSRRPVTTTRRPATHQANVPVSRGRPFPLGISRPATRPPSSTSRLPPPPPSRPRAVYPTPRPLVTATKCDPKKCLLPDCRCGGSDIPGGLRARDVPQIVLITFDDAVNELNYETYSELFDGRTNPNGCPILGTLYVSHEWTDYGMVQTLYSKGHEMASHSITHSFGEKYTKAQWLKEIHGQREILHLYGGVKMEDVRGMRAPFLQVGGNSMYEMLYEANFTYDSSLPVLDNKPPFWPYTMDYALNHECMIPPCPTKSFPGLWEVGMVMWHDYRGGRCSMGDACANPDSAETVYQMLLKNFNRHYTSNRAPFGLFYHAAWFATQHYRRGYMRFIEEINKKEDVYLVTNWQMLQWMRDPTPLSRIRDFEPWQCRRDHDLPPPCRHPTACNISYKGSSRNLKTCQPCPSVFPWLGKTGFGERYG